MIQYYYDKTTILGLPTYLLASEKGLMYVSTDEQDDEQFFNAIKQWFNINKQQCEHNKSVLSPYLKELYRFEKGEAPRQLQLSYDLRGTPFQVSVWQALLTIPFGHTTHYGAVAEKINNVKAVRAVGRAIGANPILLLVPCHRVIGKDGSLTGFRSGLTLKQKMLSHEQQYSKK